MKSLDRPRQQPNIYKTAGKTLIKFLPAVLLSLLLNISAIGQKLIINTYGFKIAAEDTVALGKLVRYEAFVYNGLFDKLIPDSLPVVINLYKNRKEFLRVRDEERALITKSGFYSPRTRQCYVYKGDDYQNVIVHEASHLFMHYHNYYGVPRWINEGMSSFFEGLYLNEKGAVYVDPQRGRLMQVGSFVNDKTIDLTQFLSYQNNIAWKEKGQVSAQYSIAYGIVYYIIKTNPQFIKQILTALNNRKSSYDALAQCYGSFELFENRFKLYYGNFR